MIPAPGTVASRGLLAGWRVLVPRGGPWGEKVAGLLADHGAEPTLAPVIAFAPPLDPAPVDRALAALADGAYAWLIITSGTTVEHLVAAAPRPLSEVARGTRVAAVGPGTAAALRRIGVVPDLLPTGESSARGLVAELPPPGPSAGPEGSAGPDGSTGSAGSTRSAGPAGSASSAGSAADRVLVPHSDLAEATVVDGLTAAGWRVDDVVAYRTVPGPVPDAAVREALTSGGVDAVLFSSASTVTNLLALAGAPAPSTVVCCIGRRTEEAARERGLTVHAVAATPSAEGLVQALVRHAEENPR